MLKEDLKGRPASLNPDRKDHPVLLGHRVQRVGLGRKGRPAWLNPDRKDHPVLLDHLVQRVSPDHQDRRVHKVWRATKVPKALKAWRAIKVPKVHKALKVSVESPVLLGHLVQRVGLGRKGRPASLNPDRKDHPVLLGHRVQRVSPGRKGRPATPEPFCECLRRPVPLEGNVLQDVQATNML